MILDKHEAEKFLKSPAGSVLMQARAERDWLANHVKVLTDDKRAEGHVDDMVAQESEWSGYAHLIAHFSGNHRWASCERVEALKLLSTRVAELERQCLR